MKVQNTIYDIIVIGSGPSGALAAYELAKRGFSVLLLEKRKLPRYKACGGGVTNKTVELLDFSIDSVVREMIDTITITLNYNDSYTQKFDYPVVYMVMRSEFDYFLAKKAEERGAELIDYTRVVRVELNNDFVDVYTDKTKYTAKFVIGAGGVYGAVQKSIGILKEREYAMAIASEAYPHTHCRKLDEFHNTLFIDFTDEIPSGYGWIFPKKDHISPGVYIVDLESVKKAANLKTIAKKYFINKDIYDSFEHNYRGYLIPRGGKVNNLHYGRALLVGDEGGLCDPLTGEGIYYGMKSALIAADVIEGCIRRNEANLSKYTHRVNKEITPDLKYARLFAILLYQHPSDFVWTFALKNIEKSYKYFARLIAGEVSYKELCFKMLGKFFKRGLKFLIP